MGPFGDSLGVFARHFFGAFYGGFDRGDQSITCIQLVHFCEAGRGGSTGRDNLPAQFFGREFTLERELRGAADGLRGKGESVLTR